MDTVIKIVIIAAIVLFWFFWYKHKKNQELKAESLSYKINNLQEQLREVEKDYAGLTEAIVLSKNKKDSLQKDIVALNEKLKDKEQAYKIAQERNDELEKFFHIKEKELQDSFEDYRIKYEDKKKNLNDTLSKIESSVKSLNHAYIVENLARDEINQNRLNIEERDIVDVNLLQNIRVQFSNPRVISKLIWQTYYQPIAKVKFASILNNETKTGIYKITNIKNNKIYIGQAVNYNRPVKNFSY